MQRLGVGRRAAQMRREASALRRFLSQVFQVAVRDDDALAHDGDSVRHELRLAQNMCGDDERGAPTSLLAEIVTHVGGGDRVQARRRLVAEDPVGMMQRGSDQRDLLRHATRVRREHRV